MRKQLLALASLVIVLAAAMPGPEPVISMKGLGDAVALSTELRAGLEPKVKALNATLEKLATIKTETPADVRARQAGMHEAMAGIHEIMMQLDPEQRAALHAYLLARFEAAGIQIHHPGHGGAPHPEHGHGTHHGHGGEHGGADAS
jgi:hypothetical protein